MLALQMMGRRFCTASGGGNSIGHVLEPALSSLPYKDALHSIHQELRFSFKDLQRVSQEWSHGLISLDYKVGDRLAVWLPTSAENLVVQLAAAHAGIVVVPINPNADDDHVAYVLQDSKCKGLVYDPDVTTGDAFLQERMPELEEHAEDYKDFENVQFPSLKYVITTEAYPLPGLLQFQHLYINGLCSTLSQGRSSELSSMDKVDLIDLYDGKTCQTLTHADAVAQIKEMQKTMSLSSDDSICLESWSGGLAVPALAAWAQNAQVVLPSALPNSEATQKAVELEDCSFLSTYESVAAI